MPHPFVLKRLNQTAHNYQAAAVFPHEVGTRLLEKLDYIKLEPQRILNLGAGTGALTQALQKRYKHAQVIGCDLAQQRLKLAHKARPWFSALQYCAADIHHLPFAAQSFDLIVSNLCLVMAELGQAFKELHRVLKPGGVLLFSSLGPDTLKELRASFAAVDQLPHIAVFLDMHDVGDAMLKQGFTDPVMDVERLGLHYASFEEMIQELKNLGSYNLHPERLKGLYGKQAWQQVKAAYQHYCQGPRWPVSTEIVYGHAWGSEPKVKLDAQGEVRINIHSIKTRSPRHG